VKNFVGNLNKNQGKRVPISYFINSKNPLKVTNSFDLTSFFTLMVAFQKQESTILQNNDGYFLGRKPKSSPHPGFIMDQYPLWPSFFKRYFTLIQFSLFIETP